MKVSELIAMLKECNPHAEVVLSEDRGDLDECWQVEVPARGIFCDASGDKKNCNTVEITR